MDSTDVTALDERKKSLYRNRWRRVLDNPKLVLIVFFASFGGFEYGYQQGVLGQSLVMYRFKDNFPSVVESSSSTGWLTSVLQLGGIVCSLSAGILGEVFSRKYTMFMACCWVVLGSYLYCGATYHNPALLYAARFFTGIGVGTFSGVGPLYNAELASSEMRGFLVSFYQFATILGIMLSFWCGYGSNHIGGIAETQSNLAWQLPSIIQGIPAAILMLGIWWLPFSPRWLMKKGRDEEAQKTLAYLRNLPVDHSLLDIEYKEIKAETLFEQRAFAKSFPGLAEKEKQSVIVGELAQYCHILRKWDAFKRVSTAWLVIVVFFVSTLPAMLIIDKVGRKPMLIAGSIAMWIFMVIPAIIVANFRHDWPSHAAGGWTAVVCIWLYTGSFGATWGPVSWTLGAAFGASSNWVNNFAVAFFVPPMFETWAWGTYIFFAVFLSAGVVWVWFCLPETKGATLEEMDRVFRSRTGEEDAIMLAQARADVGLDQHVEQMAEKAALGSEHVDDQRSEQGKA
ncbi:general substrate transporter [Aspergillus aurantiobrunneus]